MIHSCLYHTNHKDFPMNFRFVKLNQNCICVSKQLAGVAQIPQVYFTFEGTLPSAYTRASSLIANSCLTCDKYLKDISEKQPHACAVYALPQCLRILPISRCLKSLIQWETRISRDSELIQCRIQ